MFSVKICYQDKGSDSDYYQSHYSPILVSRKNPGRSNRIIAETYRDAKLAHDRCWLEVKLVNNKDFLTLEEVDSGFNLKDKDQRYKACKRANYGKPCRNLETDNDFHFCRQYGGGSDPSKVAACPVSACIDCKNWNKAEAGRRHMLKSA